MKQQPLVSVIIFTYENTKFLDQAIDSVMSQNYGRIELIISDDGSEQFDAEHVRSHIDNIKRNNIKHVVVNKNLQNMGTVKHCNKMLRQSSGDYVKMLAGDDALSDPNVLSDMVSHFLQSGSIILASQYELYDPHMKNRIRQGLPVTLINKLQSESPRDLYAVFAQSGPSIAPGIFFSRHYFHKYGYFDESYTLDEDRPLWLRLTRLGCKIDYIDRITYKYRQNGLSASQNSYSESVTIAYVEDLLRVWTQEILPNKELQPVEQWQHFLKEHLRRDEWPLEFKPPSAIRFF